MTPQRSIVINYLHASGEFYVGFVEGVDVVGRFITNNYHAITGSMISNWLLNGVRP